MTIDVVKILDGCSVKTTRGVKNIASGVQRAASCDVDGLLIKSFSAVKSDMGLDSFSYPRIGTIHCTPPNKKGFIDLGIINSQSIKINLNKYSLTTASTPKESFDGYFRLVKIMYHETRHFVQDLFVVKEKGFDAFLDRFANIPPELRFMSPAFILESLNRNYHKAFLEKCASKLPPLTPAEKKLADDIAKYPRFSDSVDAEGNLTNEYQKAPEEIDAVAFATRKSCEAIESVKTLSDKIAEHFADIWGAKKSA